MNQIEIHEFSTGIQVSSDGQEWWSTGFTGNYMNATLDPIPPSVNGAIRNREFEATPRSIKEEKLKPGTIDLSKDVAQEEPAIIGREVTDGKGDDWSVVAVVIKGRDEFGRFAPMYRYFLCEGLGKIPHILAWLLQEKKKTGQTPCFNPLERKTLNQPNILEFQDGNITEVNLEENKDLLDFTNGAKPVIFPWERKETALSVHAIAQEIAQRDKQPISWAYKVEALGKPLAFQVIKPATEQAANPLKKQIESLASRASYALRLSDEPVKKAISGLINKEPKIESLQILEEYLGKANPEVERDFWQGIFTDLGIDDALNGIRRDVNMLRLLTLRAIIFPDTLPELLSWLKQLYTGKKDDFSVFQANILNIIGTKENKSVFLQITERLEQGVRLTFAELSQHKELLSEFVDLLQDSYGLWHWVYSTIIDELDKTMSSFAEIAFVRDSKRLSEFEEREDNKIWQPIFTKLEPYYHQVQHPPDKDSGYLELASLLEQLEEEGKELNPEQRKKLLKLSALFYRVGLGEMPKAVFDKLKQKFNPNDPNLRGIPDKRGEVSDFQAQVYRLTVPREKTTNERVLEIIEGIWNGIPRGTSLLPLLIAYALGLATIPSWNTVAGLPLWAKFAAFNTKKSTKTPETNDTTQLESKVAQSLTALELLRDNFQNHSEAEKEMVNILTDRSFSSFSQMQEKPKESVKLIEDYQVNTVGLSGSEKNGVIKEKEDTFKVLKCQVAKKLGIESLSSLTEDDLKNIPDKGRIFCAEFVSKGKTKSSATASQKTAQGSITDAQWSTNKTSLESLRDELVNEGKILLNINPKEKRKPIVEQAIADTLDSEQSLNFDTMDGQKQEWVKAIKKFQIRKGLVSTKNNQPDGKIAKNGVTYNALKTAVEDELKYQ